MPLSLKALQPTCTARMKAKILQSVPSTWYETLKCMLNPLWDKTFIILGSLLLMWGKLTNPGNGYMLWEIPGTERELQKPKGYPN